MPAGLQDTEQSVDAAVVRAWLQANEPNPEPALAVEGTPQQQAAAGAAEHTGDCDLASQAGMQDTEQSVDGAVVRAWLQANKPKQEPALAVEGTPRQHAAAGVAEHTGVS